METKEARVAVLRGGPSEEHDVSLASGAGVIEALVDTSYTVVDVFIDKSGVWHQGETEINSTELSTIADVVFLALHGTYGEDGQLQAQLAAINIPFTGSDAVGSALAFDKNKTKTALADGPMRFAPSIIIETGEDCVEKIKELPEASAGWVVKPVANGSSFGVTMMSSRQELEVVVVEKLKTYNAVMVEERIVGTEVTAGVIERFLGEELCALPVVEIVPPEAAEYFDSVVKYDGSTQEICPARISEAMTIKIQEAAKFAHQTLGLQQYSRSDFIIKDEDIYFLETNTLPGLTSESLLPKEVAAAGSSYQELIVHLLQDTMSITK